ncbi:MAG: hypothetical protein ABI383_08630, partial [Acidobacteriaceae bacterium]
AIQKSAQAAADAVLLASKQFFVSERPKLSFASLDQSIIMVNKFGMHVPITATVINRGLTTSKATWLNSRVVFLRAGLTYNNQDALQSVCFAPTGMTVRTGLTVSPTENQPLESTPMPVIPLTDVRQAFGEAGIAPDGSRSVAAFVYACAVYQSDLSEQTMHEGHNYILGMKITAMEYEKIQAFTSSSAENDYVYIPKDRTYLELLKPINGFSD